jgi:hypothetical protein
MASAWDLLDDKQENELHKVRLLNVEEKPFKRITKRLSAVSILASSNVTQAPTPPAEATQGDDEEEDATKDKTGMQRELMQLKEDLTLDFAAFDSSIARLQFLLNANARERERYKVDQQRIQEESQTVTANNTQLRDQLEVARATLAQRKKFDELAEKITSNRLLRPREDQLANLQKLEEECRELEKESEVYRETWKERREQFARIMAEGELLRRQIRDEKEEVDRREGMNEDGEEDGEASRGGQTPRQIPSGNATPHPDTSGGRTPARDGGEETGLKALPGRLGAISQNVSRAPSRDVTPQPTADDGEIEEGEDVEMDDSLRPDDAAGNRGAGGETPQITIDAPFGCNEEMEVDTQ